MTVGGALHPVPVLDGEYSFVFSNAEIKKTQRERRVQEEKPTTWWWLGVMAKKIGENAANQIPKKNHHQTHSTLMFFCVIIAINMLLGEKLFFPRKQLWVEN